MSLQRQHFLLDYLKTLSVGPAPGFWTHDLPHGSPVHYQLSQSVGGKLKDYHRSWNTAALKDLTIIRGKESEVPKTR